MREKRCCRSPYRHSHRNQKDSDVVVYENGAARILAGETRNRKQKADSLFESLVKRK